MYKRQLLLACGVGLASWYRDLPVTEPQTPETLALEYVDLIFTGRYAEAEEYAKVESRTCSRGDCFLDPSFATPIEYPQLVELCLLYTSSLCVGGCGVDGRCAVVSQQSRMQLDVYKRQDLNIAGGSPQVGEVAGTLGAGGVPEESGWAALEVSVGDEASHDSS